LFGWLVDWLVSWLVGWLVGLLFGWLVGWLSVRTNWGSWGNHTDATPHSPS